MTPPEPPPPSAGDPRSQWERLLAGDPYVVDEEIAARGRRAARLADEYHRAWVAGDVGAEALLARLIGRLGEDVVVRPPLHVDFGERISIGARTFINCNLTALDVAPIAIGADCQIGPSVQLLTPTHPTAPEPRRAGVESGEPITLGDNVWLGGGVIVCPGVSIGDDTVVGAGAVVVKDLPAGVLAVGNPARVVRRL